MNEQEFLHAILPGNEQAIASILVGSGDDAAVVTFGGESLVLTTDCCIEGRHFSLDYFSPRQVGAKAVEAACSDVIAMGGYPQHVLWNLSFGSTRPLEFYQELSAGVQSACARLKCSLVGGNLVQGAGSLELTIAVTGAMPHGRDPVRRSGARIGDVVMVTGMLGGARAGLEALQAGIVSFDQVKRIHLEPRCRVDLVDKVGAHAHSLIDVSDGLSSELRHLSTASGVAIVVFPEQIPVHPQLRSFAEQHGVRESGQEALWYALHSGEEYQLLFTAPEEISARIPATVIGVVEQGSGVWLQEGDSKRVELIPAGFDHVALRA